MTMKSIFASSIFILIFSMALQAQSGGIEFFHGSYKDALEKAKREDKIIFADAFAKWCGPCKHMASTVFTDSKVGEFYNTNFICLKVDMEEPKNAEFRDKYPVSAYPTLMFIDPTKEIIVQKKVGALGTDAIIDFGKSVIGKVDNSAEFAKQWEEGKREPELVLSYVKALNRAGKSSVKVVNEFLKANNDYTNENVLKIVFEGTTEADSKIFDLMIKNRASIGALMTEEAVNKKIEKACDKTAMKAIEFKSEELHQEAKAKMSKNYPLQAESFSINADLRYYLALLDAKNYCKCCKDYLALYGKNDANKLNYVAEQLVTNFPKDKGAMKDAEKYAKKAAENGGLYNYYLTYANILHKNGKTKDAIAAANKSLELAKAASPNIIPTIENLIEKFKNS